MGLAPGTHLGTYEVIAPIGAGGMGEVYRARDRRLERDVALKVLPVEFAADADRRQRFEQEARSASALNHPNVVHVYDVGFVEGTTFIAMELVEGRTLRDLAASGPMPAKKLLDLAIQMADGLARAHEVGIVHRDLKPENVMVSKDGHVRILDFGLAKLVEPTDGDASGQVTSPQITRTGTVLGTASYMSPEQAAGRTVDFRSDQFSLGTILYELAAGRRPFQQATGPETLTAILRESPPPLAPIAPQIPAPLRWIIEERCLAKDPEERYASTRDLVRELQSLREHLSDALTVERTGIEPIRPHRLAWLLPIVALTAGSGLGALLYARFGAAQHESLPNLRRMTFRRGSVPAARFAPDGQTIVYTAVLANRPQEVLTTRIDSPESRSLGLVGAGLHAIAKTGEMAVSLGSRRISGWETRGTLARVPLGGGAPREVLEDVLEADWSPDGQRLAIVRDVNTLRRLEYPIGTALYETAGYISHVRVSPQGDRVAFLDHPIRGDNSGTVAVVDSSGNKKTLTKEFLSSDGLAWAPSGQEVWFAAASSGLKSELLSVTLDGNQRMVWRESGPLSLRDISRDGRLLIGRQTQSREIFGLAPGADAERELSWLDWSFPLDLSDDGQTLLFDEEGEGAGESYTIYVRKTDGSAAVRLAQGSALALSPDGQSVLGQSGKSLLMLPIGAGTPRTLPIGELTLQQADFFPDGQHILLSANAPNRPTRLYLTDVNGASPRAISQEGLVLARLGGDLISPDGQWIATKGPDGRITLLRVANGEQRPVDALSPEEAVARWTADGRGLFVYQPGVSIRVELFDLASGRRTPWKTLAPADPAGVPAVGPILISSDGKSYIYSYTRLTEDLYLVDGLK